MKPLSDTTAAILAGGLGTRLRSVTADKPKVLIEVAGRPFLANLLDQLAIAGIGEAVLCTGHLGEQIHSTFGDSHLNLRLVYSHETSPLGTGGALRRALPLITSDTVLVMNGDSYCDVSLEAFWAWHHTRVADASIVLTRVPDVRRFGQIRIDPDGRVLKFEEKNAEARSGWINAGIYLMNVRLLQTIPAGEVVSLEHEIFPHWVDHSLFGYKCGGRFLDIGTPESLSLAEKFFGSDDST